MGYIHHLPVEILVNIFQYLDWWDVPHVKLTCRRWYNILISHNVFLEKSHLYLKDCILNDTRAPALDILNSERVFSKIVFKNTTFHSPNMFWSQIGSFVKDITFDECDFANGELIRALFHLPNLQFLVIKSSRLETSCMDYYGEIFQLVHLKSVCFRSVFLYDKILQSFQLIFPNVQVLKLNESSYYGDGSTSLISFVTNISPSLVELNLSYTKVNSSFLDKMASLEKLKLKKITLKSCYEIRPPDIVNLVKKQPHIIHLNLDNIFSLDDNTLQQISQNLPNLQRVKVHIGKISNFYESFLANLKSLIYLKVTDDHYSLGNTHFGRYENDKLEKLYVSAGNFVKNMLPRFFKSCPNIKSLTLYQCTYENLAELQAAFIFLKDLENLNLQRTFTLSDGFFREHSSSNAQTFVPITQLTKLKYLNLSRCTDLSDETIKKLAFPNLRKIDLRGLYITHVGIFTLVAQCPNIVNFHLDSCRKIDDEAIFYIVKNLKYLKLLNLEGCRFITDASIYHILDNCKNLVWINITSCSRITDAAKRSLQRLRTLKNIYK